MKKFLFVTATVLLASLSSCTEKSTSTTGTGNPAAEKAKANSRAILKAIESGDVSKIDSFITADGVDHSGANGMEEIKGIDNIKKDLGTMKQDFSSINFDVLNEAAEGDHLFQLVKMTGTTSAAPGHGMPANKIMEMTSVDLYKFNNDGKLSDHWSYNDPKDMMKMMGGDKVMAPATDKKMAPKTENKMMDRKMMDSVKKMK